jgi:hypothetical protein
MGRREEAGHLRHAGRAGIEVNTAGPVIRARYLENEEYLLAAWDRNPAKSRAWNLVLIALSIAFLLTLPVSFRERAKGDPGWWITSATALFIAAFLIWWLNPLNQRRLVRKSIRKRITSPPTEAWFEFSEDGFMITGQGGRSAFHPWSTIPKVLQLCDGFLAYFDEHYYYWVPLDTFASAEEYGTVTKLAQSKVKRFQQTTG